MSWRAVLALLLACAACGGDDGDASSEAGAGAGQSGSAAGGASGSHAGGSHATNAGQGGSDAGRSGSGAGAGRGGSDGGIAGAGGTGAPNDAGSTADAGDGSAGGDASTPDDGGSGQPLPLAQQVCPQQSFGSPLPSENPQAELVQGGFGFIEGPVWLQQQGWLLFSDMNFGGDQSNGPPSRIRRLVPPSTFDVFLETANSNGLALDLDGAVLACTHDLRTLTRYLPSNAMRETRELRYMGMRFDSPNDLTVRSDGNVYFTDPNYQLGPRSSEVNMSGVYRVAPNDEVTLIDTLNQPNGITLSLDERTLYVASASNDIKQYPIADDGNVGDGTVFASPGACDGMGIDCAGNVYLTLGSGVRVLSPEGELVGTITLAEQPANVAFGGADRKTLYITARTGLYSIELLVPGLPY